MNFYCLSDIFSVIHGHSSYLQKNGLGVQRWFVPVTCNNALLTNADITMNRFSQAILSMANPSPNYPIPSLTITANTTALAWSTILLWIFLRHLCFWNKSC